MAFPKSGCGLVGSCSSRADGGIIHTMERGGFAENAYIAIADHATSLRNSFIHTMKGGTAENCVVMFATGGAKLHNCHIFELGEGCEGTGLMGLPSSCLCL